MSTPTDTDRKIADEISLLITGGVNYLSSEIATILARELAGERLELKRWRDRYADAASALAACEAERDAYRKVANRADELAGDNDLPKFANEKLLGAMAQLEADLTAIDAARKETKS